MKSTTYHRVICLAGLALLLACHEDLPEEQLEMVGLSTEAKNPGEEKTSSSNEVEHDHGLRPKAGPDDAFFVGAFLSESLEFLSQSKMVIEALEALDPEYFATAMDPRVHLSAFDYRQNFSEQRLTLMTDYLLFLNDHQGHQRLSPLDLKYLKINPQVLGNPGEIAQLELKAEIATAIAGPDGLVGKAELRMLLQALGTVVEEHRQKLGIKPYRHQVLDGWDKVVDSYDVDHDGVLSRVEYTELRQDRQQKLDQLRRSLSLRYGS